LIHAPKTTQKKLSAKKHFFVYNPNSAFNEDNIITAGKNINLSIGPLGFDDLSGL